MKAPVALAAAMIVSSMTAQPVGGDEVVFVETNHPADRVLDVAWRLDGELIPNPRNSRNLDLGALDLPSGTYELAATVTDPAGGSDAVEWTVDNVLPTAHRTLSEPLTTLQGDLEHPVYFNGWDMFLDPKDDLEGYDEERFVVGQLRLDRDGWFNYFGFPEQQDAPFQFRHSGTNIKALTYGNLGTGGLSRATFEQTLPDDHPSGGFIPGFGTHLVEHRAIDPAGNYGEVVRPGASLVASDTVINGTLRATGADIVQLFGARVNGATSLSGTTSDITIAGSAFNGALVLTANTQVSDNERYTRLAGEYGPMLVGSSVNGALVCTGNSAEVKDFGAQNRITGARGGDCSDL